MMVYIHNYPGLSQQFPQSHNFKLKVTWSCKWVLFVPVSCVWLLPWIWLWPTDLLLLLPSVCLTVHCSSATWRTCDHNIFMRIIVYGFWLHYHNAINGQYWFQVCFQNPFQKTCIICKYFTQSKDMKI